MKVTLDPTSRDIVRITIDQDGALSDASFPSSEDRAGSRLIAELTKLHLSAADELRVVVGPGHFTGIRVAALVGNALHYTYGVHLFQKNIDDADWQAVDSLVPYYASAPSINPPRV